MSRAVIRQFAESAGCSSSTRFLKTAIASQQSDFGTIASHLHSQLSAQARSSFRMLSSKMLRRSAGKLSQQTRHFSRTTPAQKIITNAPLRAKEASPFINNKYPVVDREYYYTAS